MKKLMLASSVFFFPLVAHAQTISDNDRVQINTSMVGCPTETDGEIFIKSWNSAENSGDYDAKVQAMESAMSAGCVGFHPGDTGTVVDTDGIFDVWYKIKMDGYPHSYWFPQSVVSLGYNQ
jgi:hypothetical protein